MASPEEKANVTTSDSSSKADDATGTLTTETNISSSIMLSVEETLVVSGNTEMGEDIEGVNDEGKALIAASNEESEKQEEANENDESENEEAEDGTEKEEEADYESQNEEESNEEKVVAEDEANEEESNEEKVVAEDEAYEEVASEEGEEEEEEEAKENEGNVGEEQNEEDVEVKPKEGGRKPRKRSRKRKVVEQKGSEVVTLDGDKPESSNKKKASKKVEGMGMIFMCSSKTKTDCFRYKILGLPAGKKDQVQKIYKGMRLFLFDIDLRLMYGIFKAAAPGGYNIEPKAFQSAFPSQVRFTVLDDCLPLAEEKFKKVLKENYYSRNKFHCQLTSEQVKKLCNLFTVAGKGSTSKAGGRSRKAEAHASVDQGRRKRRAQEEERRPEAHASVDQGRRKRQAREEERRPVSRREHRYREHYESPRAPPRRLEQLPPLAPAPVYVYERSLERDSYMRDPVLEHRGLRYIESEPRRRDEIRVHEPYIVYREAPSYRDAAYLPSRPLEYAPPTTLPIEYRHVSREYHSDTGRSAAYRFPGGLQPGYHAVDRGYYPASTSVPEYQSNRRIYRY